MSDHQIDVRRAADRFHSHSFSFGPHYDGANTHHGLLALIWATA